MPVATRIAARCAAGLSREGRCSKATSGVLLNAGSTDRQIGLKARIVEFANNRSVGNAPTFHASGHPGTQNSVRLSGSRASAGKFNDQRALNAASIAKAIRLGFRNAVMVKQGSAPIATAAFKSGAKQYARLARD